MWVVFYFNFEFYLISNLIPFIQYNNSSHNKVIILFTISCMQTAGSELQSVIRYSQLGSTSWEMAGIYITALHQAETERKRGERDIIAF